MSPKVSIVTPTKNRSALLREAIASLQEQTYGNWEAVVIDDGSTDDTHTWMQKLALEDRRVTFQPRRGPRSGAPAARNEGLAQATGEYVIFLDSDDCLAPTCLERRVSIMQANDQLDFAVFPLQLMRRTRGDLNILGNAQTEKSDLDRFLALDVPWSTCAVIWRRSAVDAIGRWDEDLLSWQDFELHLRALILGLRHQWFLPPDCYWRMPEETRESITRRATTPAHLRSKERCIAGIQKLLSERHLDTPQRRAYVARLYFEVATNWAGHGEQGEARRVWASCRERGLIARGEYLEGLCVLRVQRVPLARGLGRRYLAARWRRRLMSHASSWARYAAYDEVGSPLGTVSTLRKEAALE